MQLRAERVKWNDKAVKRIYLEAFPKEERMPFSLMVVMSKMRSTEFLAFYEQDALCGFVYLACGRTVAFVMFFAVDEKLRSKGYGSAILSEIRQRYPEKKLIVSLEPCDDNAPNAALRKRRKEFYRRNGYQETGYMIKLAGVVQEVMIANGEFSKEEFRSFLTAYSNGAMRPEIWERGEVKGPPG